MASLDEGRNDAVEATNVIRKSVKEDYRKSSIIAVLFVSDI